jgi:hypothetical protein
MDEKTETTIDKVTTHFQEHWKDYCLSIGAIVIVGIGIYFHLNEHQKTIPTINVEDNVESKIKIFTVSGDNSTIINNTFTGRQRKIVQCIETGQIWSSITEAAEDLGIPINNISKVINGHKESTNGLHFKALGLTSG